MFENFIALHNIQHTSRNRSLKGPILGSADKCTTLLLLAWPIEPVFYLQFFLYKATLLNSHWLATVFEVKKIRVQSYFLLILNEKSGFVWKNLKVENQLQDQVCQQEFCKFYPNIHCMPHSTLNLWNDAEWTFKCKWPNTTCQLYMSSLLEMFFWILIVYSSH